MNDRWAALRTLTQARLGLARAGDTLATKEWLALQLAHAQARDAVHAPWDVEGARAGLVALGEVPLVLATEAKSRREFLLRPDRGRGVPAAELAKLAPFRGKAEVVFCISDGLSSAAVAKHLLPFWRVFRTAFATTKLSLAPPVLVPFGRVAAADPIGEALEARVAVIAVGERPGMSAADSLGLYLTFAPREGRRDAERNCLSNVRPPDGMSYELATKKLLFLLAESLRRGLSGVALKDDASLLRDVV